MVGSGQVVSELAFYSDELILNPAEVHNFNIKVPENEEKEAGNGPI